MPEFLTDQQIQALIDEPKLMPTGLYSSTPALRDTKVGHKGAQFDVAGAAGSDFRVMIRQSNANALDFSVILAYLPKNTSQVFRLRRYNGKSHEHTNPIEKESFYQFHIHLATERYQREGFEADKHAEPTDRFNDLAGAIECLLADCAFQRSSNATS